MIDFGEGIVLRALNEMDSFVLGWRNDPKIWAWTRQNDLISSEDHAKWFKQQSCDPSIKMYVLYEGGGAVGVCGLTSINLQNRNAEFSLYLAPSAQGRNLAKPSLITLFSHGFMNMGLRSIWGETFEDNPAQKIFDSIGMKCDGVRRQFYWKDGKFKDAILFSMLDSEFINRHGRRSCFGSLAPAS